MDHSPAPSIIFGNRIFRRLLQRPVLHRKYSPTLGRIIPVHGRVSRFTQWYTIHSTHYTGNN